MEEKVKKTSSTNKTNTKRSTRTRSTSARKGSTTKRTATRNSKSSLENKTKATQTRSKSTTTKKVVKAKADTSKDKKVLEQEKVKEKSQEVESINLNEQDLKVTEEKAERDVLLEKTIIIDGLQNKNIADVVKNLEESNVLVEDKIIKRSKAKKVIIAILTTLIIGILVVTTKTIVENVREIKDYKSFKETVNSDIHSKAQAKYDSEDDIEESEDSSIVNDIEYDHIKTILLSDFEKKAYNNEDMIVLVSSTSCYACIVFEPIVNTAFESLGKTIYRLNISNMDSAERNKFRNYYGFTSTPTIFVVKDGIVTADYKGYMNSDDLIEWVNENY